MKLGFVSAILDTYTYEEMIDFASINGFECVEAASWLIHLRVTNKKP